MSVSPSAGHYEKCRKNIADGLRPYLIVPHAMFEGTRQNAENAAEGKILVNSIESFVAQNVDELGTFTSSSIRQQLRSLIETYNQRVDAVENDKSLLIELPPNL